MRTRCSGRIQFMDRILPLTVGLPLSGLVRELKNGYRHLENVRMGYRHLANCRMGNLHLGNVRMGYRHLGNCRMGYRHHGNIRMGYRHHGNCRVGYRHRGMLARALVGLGACWPRGFCPLPVCLAPSPRSLPFAGRHGDGPWTRAPLCLPASLQVGGKMSSSSPCL